MKREYRLVIGVLSIVAGTVATSGAVAADGKTVYTQTCAACHVSGVGGAPKLTDKAAWAPRVGAGQGAMVAAVLKGKGAMPPKGGNASLTDADVQAAVDYMLSQVK